MKTPNARFLCGVLCAGMLATSVPASTLSASRVKALRNSVGTIAVPEMPAKAAELVRQAPTAEKEEVAIIVVEEAVRQHRASGPAVVAAVAKAAPDVAGAAAVAASRVVPEHAPQIAQSAITAAPQFGNSIAGAVSQAVPTQESAVRTALGPQYFPTASAAQASETHYGAAGAGESSAGTGDSNARGSASHDNSPSSGAIHRDNENRIHGSPHGPPDPFPGHPPFGTPPPVHRPYHQPRD